jgi:hypothetical protein
MSGGVRYRCRCERDDCNWEREITEKNSQLAQRVSGAAMAGHGIATGHSETKREKLDPTDA